MLKNRLYLFTPASVPGIITPEQTRLINESSGLLDAMPKDTLLDEWEGKKMYEKKNAAVTPKPSLAPLTLLSTPSNRVKQCTLVIWDSITCNVRLASPATVYCLLGARASNIKANLRVLASCRENLGTHADTTTSFSNIIILIIMAAPIT